MLAHWPACLSSSPLMLPHSPPCSALLPEETRYKYSRVELELSSTRSNLSVRVGWLAVTVRAVGDEKMKRNAELN
uniref:Uncharacterized protein n=1 Tax=Arundo donax TaxID=35708 RepID=A0A0A9C914_ARUDO